jgi:hypothetical protein
MTLPRDPLDDRQAPETGPAVGLNRFGQPRCTASTKSGRPCPTFALADGFCYQHSPSIDPAKKRASHSAGGRAHTGMLSAEPDPELTTRGQRRRARQRWLGGLMRGESSPQRVAVALMGLRDQGTEEDRAEQRAIERQAAKRDDGVKLILVSAPLRALLDSYQPPPRALPAGKPSALPTKGAW